MKAANFDNAFNAKDEATLNAYADRIVQELNALGRYDLRLEIIFGTDPFGECPDLVNDPNGFRVLQNKEEMFDIYTPTEHHEEGDSSQTFSYSNYGARTEDSLWGKEVTDNDCAEIAAHLNAELPCVGVIFYENDREKLTQIADDLNNKIQRNDARVMIVDGAEVNEIRLMIVGWDEENDECTDEYGYFLDLPYTDISGTDKNYSITYAGYPHPDCDYSFSAATIDELVPEIEQLDLC